jgi:hypothetical protein
MVGTSCRLLTNGLSPTPTTDSPFPTDMIMDFYKNKLHNICLYTHFTNRLCGLVVSVADYKHRGPGFDSRALLRIFLRELGRERGPLSLVIG